jgi:hypothetical protein
LSGVESGGENEGDGGDEGEEGGKEMEAVNRGRFGARLVDRICLTQIRSSCSGRKTGNVLEQCLRHKLRRCGYPILKLEP